MIDECTNYLDKGMLSVLKSKKTFRPGYENNIKDYETIALVKIGNILNFHLVERFLLKSAVLL